MTMLLVWWLMGIIGAIFVSVYWFWETRPDHISLGDIIFAMMTVLCGMFTFLIGLGLVFCILLEKFDRINVWKRK